MLRLIYDNNKYIDIASTWEELNSRQWLRIVKLLHSGISDKNLDKKADEALWILSMKTLFMFLIIKPLTRGRMWEHAAWVFETGQNITCQLLPRYKSLYGPAADFDNLVMQELHACELAFDEIKNGNEDESSAALIRLAAILYRPAKKWWLPRKTDKRIAFDSDAVEKNIVRIGKWPLHVKQAILMWYDGCRNNLYEMYSDAFTNETKTSESEPGLFEVMRSIAGGKYGSFEQVMNMPVHLAFREMVAAKKEYDEVKKMYDKK